MRSTGRRCSWSATCVTCHVVNNAGTPYGPELSEIGTKLSKEAIYTSILYPNAGISVGFEGSIVSTKDGDDLDGIVVSDAADEITLRRAGGVTTPVKKSEIKERRAMKLSIMPENLQQQMTTQDLVDLVEYLSTLKKARGGSEWRRCHNGNASVVNNRHPEVLRRIWPRTAKRRRIADRCQILRCTQNDGPLAPPRRFVHPCPALTPALSRSTGRGRFTAVPRSLRLTTVRTERTIPRMINIPQRILLGPGPSDTPARMLEALGRPTIGHLDPVFLQLMDEIRAKLKEVFRTTNEMTMAMSGTGSAGMETVFVNLVEPGDKVLVGVNGVFGGRMADVAGRCGAVVEKIEAAWGQVFDQDEVIKAIERREAEGRGARARGNVDRGARSRWIGSAGGARAGGAVPARLRDQPGWRARSRSTRGASTRRTAGRRSACPVRRGCRRSRSRRARWSGWRRASRRCRAGTSTCR